MNVKVILNCTGVVLLSGSCTRASQNGKDADQPNVVYILADDLGYGDLGCYGQEIIHTPNIDKLAADGMLFTQHYAGSTVSAPSRSSLMTGLHTGHTYIRGNKEHSPEGQEPLPGNTYTLAKMFKQAGYVTGAFGKWGLGYPGSEGDPVNLGFDVFFGYNCQRKAHNYYPDHLYHNQDLILLDGNQGLKKEQYSQDVIHAEAMRFLRENAHKKFFLFLPYVLPHAELTSPHDSIYELYQGKIEEKAPYKGVDSGEGYKDGSYGSSETPHADFASMVTRLDAYVGDVVAILKQMGIDKNTLVVFSSDNGPHKEGGADPDFFDSNAHFRGYKRDLYEGGIRMPMIASWPGKIKAGAVNEHISAFWDMMPTFEELAGVKSDVKTDGISMLPSLLGKGVQKEHPYLYWEFHEGGGKIAVRKGQWKGIKLNYKNNPDGKMLLFDLSEDIHEDHDVADQHPEIVAELEGIMKNARTESALFNFGARTVIR